MDRKHVSLFAILGIMVLLVSILGCQGYKAPAYKSPEGSEGTEEVAIDVSDLEDSDVGPTGAAVAEDDWSDEEAATYVAEKEVAKVAQPVKKVTAYKPIASDVAPAEKEAAPTFSKSPYRSLAPDNLPTTTVTEGQVVKIAINAKDPDGDTLTYTFESPLNSNGQWQTRAGDAGVYTPVITVTDGKDTVTKQIKIIVEPKNNKPVLEFIPNIVVNEGEKVTISPRAKDADNDKLTYTYTGWMGSSTKETQYDDQGEHKVVVSVTDGISIVSQEVLVTVRDVNRPPEVEIEF